MPAFAKTIESVADMPGLIIGVALPLQEFALPLCGFEQTLKSCPSFPFSTTVNTTVPLGTLLLASV